MYSKAGVGKGITAPTKSLCLVGRFTPELNPATPVVHDHDGWRMISL